MPRYLFSFDSVNFALALDDFDPARNQPQPPGYPFFVGEARLLDFLLDSPERAFTVSKLVVGTLAVALLYLLGSFLFSPVIGVAAATLLLVNPVFWHTSLASSVRMHLALFSILFAYFCWRSLAAGRRQFFAASAVLALSGGFRAELPLVLLPLWFWAAWRQSKRTAFLGLLLIIGGSLIWIAAVIVASGNATTLETFNRYFFDQTYQSSLISGANFSDWKRMLGRSIVWYAAGAMCWIWALPFGWEHLRESPGGMVRMAFLAIWLAPAFLLNAFVHVAAPGHTLAGIPAACVVGAVCLSGASEWIRIRWQTEVHQGALLAGAVLVCCLLFFVEYLPARNDRPVEPSMVRSITDPLRYGMYESSYSNVRWIEQMSDLAFRRIQELRSSTQAPVVAVWSRDAVPAWRKVAYYFPDLPVYTLEEAGDPAVVHNLVRVWRGSSVAAAYSQGSPVKVPLPNGARIIWLLSGSAETRLKRAVPLKDAAPLYYTDLPPEAHAFQWGSFSFVPEQAFRTRR
jgi:hypothetical protein